MGGLRLVSEHVRAPQMDYRDKPKYVFTAGLDLRVGQSVYIRAAIRHVCRPVANFGAQEDSSVF